MDKEIRIDTRLESYKSFYDSAWEEQFLNRSNGTPLAQLAIDLASCWRATATTHAMPWLMFQHLQAVAESMMEAEEPVGRKLVVAMKSRLSVELGDDLRNMQKIKLSKAVDKIAAEVDSALNGNQMSFDIAEIWKGYYAGSKVHQLASSAGAAYRAQGWRK